MVQHLFPIIFGVCHACWAATLAPNVLRRTNVLPPAAGLAPDPVMVPLQLLPAVHIAGAGGGSSYVLAPYADSGRHGCTDLINSGSFPLENAFASSAAGCLRRLWHAWQYSPESARVHVGPLQHMQLAAAVLLATCAVSDRLALHSPCRPSAFAGVALRSPHAGHAAGMQGAAAV